MSEYLLWALTVAVVAMLLLMLRLLHDHRKLRQAYGLLEAQIQRNHDDLAGLCSAAVAVDRRLANADARLNSIAERVAERPRAALDTPAVAEAVERPAQGYEDVIAKIRRGVGVEDLVRDCGLTRDEAVLLTRLHGGRSRL
ncbi:DUF2802 domain-containing protein [Methylomonas sp. MED-D]|uniref:DUF2802 domain-containing protein n=1 Tax=unclassified Methylomonas TaxID=2608980 RepID=UPI0008D967C6|nr:MULTISPECIES: DUF2802 domain-containing protein [unclassified Methylomonas]MDT4330271.1 DUF2802 domain-containing protein [Methylomonas sp. MV1]NJA08410.1 DUF2802 domain-containing protein [Methylococcaceae bacterium WWC4]OHX38301.1 hypothetical protein BJL95_14330 [Methylomonas sp. LWB]WGS86588.1 DUF2802 domain-containing protein [Methylomonas sp. UP202]